MAKVQAVVYTTSHMIHGYVSVKERVQETLIDRMTDFLDLTDTVMVSLADPRREEKMPRATVPKAQIACVTLDIPSHENLQARQTWRVDKAGSKVCAVVGGIEVWGTAHLKSPDERISRIVTQQLSAFFPVTDATILLTQRPSENLFTTQVALVNRDKVAVLSLL